MSNYRLYEVIRDDRHLGQLHTNPGKPGNRWRYLVIFRNQKALSKSWYYSGGINILPKRPEVEVELDCTRPISNTFEVIAMLREGPPAD